MLYMFRTVLVHHQEQLYKLYIAFGICRYMPIRLAVVWLLYKHNSQTYDTGIYQMRCTAYKVAPDGRLIYSETCRASNGKWSLITEICAFCWFICIFQDDARCIQFKLIVVCICSMSLSLKAMPTVWYEHCTRYPNSWMNIVRTIYNIS